MHAEGASSDLLAMMAGVREVEAALSDRARIQAMLDVEAALAEAEAALGVIPAAAAAPIRSAARGQDYPLRELADQASSAGNLLIPLLSRFRQTVAASSPEAAGFVHWGATSQDIIDTALALQLRAALSVLLDDTDRAARAAARHARQHATTVMAGRTWLQQATPVTFGLKAAGWLDAILSAAKRVRASRDAVLVLQFGGASGTLAALGGQGPAVARELASRLDLALPPLPWHAQRIRVAALAADLGILTGAFGKIAQDLSLLAQSEIAEAFDAPEAAGGSSTMPHKRNPVRASIVQACALRAPGLVATMLGAMPQEHERGPAGWQAEWDVLPDLVRTSASAARATAALLEGLVVDAGRMRQNLEQAGGVTMAEAVVMRLAGALGPADARQAVEAAVKRAAAEPRPFAEILAADPRVSAVLDREAIDRALAPEHYLGSSGQFIQAVLEAYEREEHTES
ncbi:MAG TPA: 3-carboxy-cis,cis-muconate cycloisomerase [Vicinamibacterales bacterium]|nr:3-carboxy-cis,cis-muconate cycloisomerase [Vicinamibacterales bacterium]